MAQPFPSFSALLSNERNQQLEAIDVLLRISRNIIKNPENPNVRSIRLSSSVVMNKLLPTSGALECLFEMGFQEGSDCLVMPLDHPIDKVRLFHNELLRLRENSTQESLPTPCSSTKPTIPAKPDSCHAKQTATCVAKLRELSNLLNNQFFKRILSRCEEVLQYENKKVQIKALRLIPLLELKLNVENSMRKLQTLYKKKEISNEPQNYQELMLINLINWFKSGFFSWVNTPECSSCGEQKTTAKGIKPATEAEIKTGIDRTEVYECTRCNGVVLFPRYNNAERLLDTRRGRCGEWANCFTLMCRALGWDARLVHDETDHAWTEVYMILTQTWVHCDPCEGIVDAPLLYEAGWKKQLTYVMAYSCEGVQDVTWRYSSHHKQVLQRRKLCDEEALAALIVQIRGVFFEFLSSPRRNFLLKRILKELVDMTVESPPTPEALRGRISGDLAWRLARGEAGAATGYCWHITEAGVWILGYSAAKDQYILGTDLQSPRAGWMSGVHRTENLHRKVEHDWKMVYLARTEGAQCGKIEWMFELVDSLMLDKVELKFRTSLYHSGRVTATLCNGDVCVNVPEATGELSTMDFSGCKTLLLAAVLCGGEGDVAWQHAQLFRQPLSDQDIPFQITLHVKPTSSDILPRN